MKKQTYLKDENLLTLLSLHDFIIPEIQREYVWGSLINSEKVLVPFLNSIKISAKVDESCHYAHGLENQHMGFLYSYKPQYIRDISSRISDEYIIDGQQRFTSLFLLLFVRAVIEERILDFNNLVRWEEYNIAFDYKVRQLTHKFIYDLIAHVQTDGKSVLKNIIEEKYPCWLLNDYLKDTTVGNIINAIKCIFKIFNNDSDYYYDYLLTRIHFWHFKTDVTSQGEELYITMNSRGEELSDNEAQKARRLKNTDQTKWGPLWEEWQTYFWRNRNQGDAKNFDADRGFNNLLACMDAMGDYMKQSYDSIQDTNTAIDSLKFIVDTDWVDFLHQQNPNYYTEWLVEFKKDIWTRINTTNAKWKIQTDSDTTQRENAVLLWPLFYFYFKEIRAKNSKPNQYSFVRLMHLCYLNYKSRKTNHAYIKEFIDELCEQNGSDILLFANKFNNKFLSEENHILFKEISKAPISSEMESIIWEVQNKQYFLDGKDVGGNTIIDYVKDILNMHLSLRSPLQNIMDNYDVLFPSNDSSQNEILLKRILLFFKNNNSEPFWKQVSPYYDRNYETSSWKRIVRHGAFLEFYKRISKNYQKVICVSELNLLIDSLKREFFSMKENRCFSSSKWSDRRLAILFDTMTNGELWRPESYPDIVFHEDVDSIGRPFISTTTVWNRVTGRKFTWQKVAFPDKWESILQGMYPLYDFTY